MYKIALVTLFLSWSFSGLARAQEPASPAAGQRWVCLGDSITAANCYPPLLERIGRHQRPEAPFAVINSGQGGDTASDSPEKLQNRVLKHGPSVVSIMYGMNEAINTWRARGEKQVVLERYRKALTYMTKELKARQIRVLLMSPTPTEPTTRTYYGLDKTVPFLKECAAVMREVALAEGATYVPVQEEFLALQERVPANVVLTTDGVHPHALGQYSIARTLWRHSGYSPGGASGPEAQAELVLPARFVPTGTTALELEVHSKTTRVAELTWSMGKARGSRKLALLAGKNAVQLELPVAELPARAGAAGQVLLDLKTEAGTSLYFLDLARTRVLHLQDNKVSGVVETTAPETRRQVATWEMQRLGKSLLLNFEVLDKEIEPDGVWPFSRDGLNLMLDFRPTDRFGDIGVDREVTQLFLNVRDEPFFSVGLRSWTGQGMDYSATAAGTRTATGYKVQLFIHENFTLHSAVDLHKRDFVGLLVGVAHHDTELGATGLTITTNQVNDQPVGLYANNLMILDLKNAFPGPEILNVRLNAP